MDWLWQNPVAEMYGPPFLLFYAGVSAATVVACRFAVRRLDWTGRMPPPPVPAAPDPYEIAYMRGGENEVTRAGVFALIKRGLLDFSRDGTKFLVQRTAAAPPREHLSKIERCVYDWFDRPRDSREVFQRGGLADKLKGLCAGYEQALRRDHMLTPPDVASRVALARLSGVAVIAGLGAYKLAAALAHGRTNVGFLVVMGVVAVLVLFAATRAPRISRRGREHLERLRIAFDRLKDGGVNSNTSGRTADYADATRELLRKDGEAPAVARAVDPTLVALGVFGVAALASTDYQDYKAAFGRASADTGGGGSSCGSSCGSSDSSSGGGGDGGGGGCGGGCGGCGGGD